MRKLLPYLVSAGVIIFIAVFAPFLTPFDPYLQDTENALEPPNFSHLLGTDIYGRDLFSRIIMGAQITVLSSLSVVISVSVIGVIVGAFAGFIGGKTDGFIMRVGDIFLAFPQMVFAIAMSAVLGGGLFNAALSIIVIAWPKYARIARSLTIAVSKSEYVAAAKISGGTDFNILKRHILPNIIEPIIVTAALDIGAVIMGLAGLSFLGLGAKPPAAEWGQMMNVGRNYLQIAPHIILAPGVAIFITVAVFNSLADKLRDVLDVR